MRTRNPLADKTYHLKQKRAANRVREAHLNGELAYPERCELCDKKAKRIITHHWRGHDYPLDVWFVCDACNFKLHGPERHNGSITKDLARALVRG